jgi:SAM-dependent methyltransferase
MPDSPTSIGIILTLPQESVMNHIAAPNAIPNMKIADPAAMEIRDEVALISSVLPLDGARVLELGCGKAEKTRAIATGARLALMIAMEVDAIQHDCNLLVRDLPAVDFRLGGAEAIPAPDADFDLVFMFKSLHHVPIQKMDQAMSELKRVLKPGGMAWLSEPVYAGDFNDILRMFHDEKTMREAAFAAIQRAVNDGMFELVEQHFFNTPAHFDSFEQFETQILGVTHTRHELSAALHQQVKDAFMRHMTPHGVDFLSPIRVDLLRKPARL